VVPEGRNKKTILIIEDEAAISELLSYSLEREGFRTMAERTGRGGLDRLKSGKADLLLLDLMLPDMDGLDICKKVKSEREIPVIILTAKSDIVDKVSGFNFGADDYITKPFDVREVNARVRTAFRRIEDIRDRTQNLERILLGENTCIHVDEHKVTRNGQAVELTPREFELLHILTANKGVVFTRSKLLDRVWGYDCAVDTRAVDIHIVRLRKKLGDDDGSIIRTVFGVGYKLDS
jgi:DNA-binding response OmpR family regulator